MSEAISRPRGVPDYVPPESKDFLFVRQGLSRGPALAGYGYIELPVFEYESLFARGVGESSDVVSKEMYTFSDRAERPMALRPEGTAGVMRAVIQNNLHRGQLPVKLWYEGPFFRAERPAKGRYRQLQQVGLEAIGSDDPALDAEVVALADQGFRGLGLTQFRLKMTSLGCRECRPRYREVLAGFLAELDLDDETRERARVNPLRVLDDKRDAVQAQLVDVPVMVDHLCAQCQAHYDETRALLRVLGVQWQEAPRLVRGLDYYTRTTFEFDHPLLGAQSGIGGGGRYDGLMTELGGPDLSGIGWGIGTDRTLLAAQAEGVPMADPARVRVFGVALAEEARTPLLSLINDVRAAGISADLAYGKRGLKGAMKAADRSGAHHTLLLGEDELAKGIVTVKNMQDGSQTELPVGDVVGYLLEAKG